MINRITHHFERIMRQNFPLLLPFVLQKTLLTISDPQCC